jgi:hypothetical protein
MPACLVQYVIKRSGKKEPVHFDKITARISKLCYGLDPVKVQPVLVAQKVRGAARGQPAEVVLSDSSVVARSRSSRVQRTDAPVRRRGAGLRWRVPGRDHLRAR